MFKSIFSFIFIFTLAINSFGQEFDFGIVQDKDGFVNVRESKSSTSKVLDRLDDGEIVYHFGREGNWIDVNYLKNNIMKAPRVLEMRGLSTHQKSKVKLEKEVLNQENIKYN